ncbi:aconitate hydratase AcnA [Terriglobus saanensis]|uniref:Aconitate hydratase n=1 Tax=Terriglobus saanensis (strain ATCC BAA-1853 / DSM 23119 / SP1PR4) TaxID=401053 RepID=E8V3G4_TERSS|nr:aconitate hydratase AcnA [Terriglobus saanensis]ADV83577.1 aconitate hydratase 1 [Terriglobus saanensis SP1PR4]
MKERLNDTTYARTTKLLIANVEYVLVSAGWGDENFRRLPCSLKILAENAARRSPGSLNAFQSWLAGGGRTHAEIEFYPARVLMHDTTCVPALVDIAALRDAVVQRGGDPAIVNPQIPVDLVIDHSVMVDRAGSADAFLFNLDRDFERNAERYSFIRWAQQSLANFRVVPPATGILHQVNLEHLSEVVRVVPQLSGPPMLVPDTLVGTDSHTPMINALGILAWGVGGIEGEAAALGQPIALRVPEVVGIRLVNRLRAGVNATDLALTLTEVLRGVQVIEKIVEFFGPGITSLNVADRATVSNMAPEYGATSSLFPIDERTLEYLRLIGKSAHHVEIVEDYAKVQGLWHTPDHVPMFTEVVEFDLATVEPSLAGPKRPQDRVALSQVRDSFLSMLAAAPIEVKQPRSIVVPGQPYSVQDGAVLIASITSCTNTSNPALMIGAGLLARNARRNGLSVPPWVKTSLSPGSHVVSDYLLAAGLQAPLDELGFQLVGYGCMTCIGNSGQIDDELALLAQRDELVGTAVLSGNRNFEDRINPSVRAAYLGSPALVVAYALAGSVLINLATEPLSITTVGVPVYLADIWPTDEEIEEVFAEFVTPSVFRGRSGTVFAGPEAWQKILSDEGQTYKWREQSTYLRQPTYFDDVANSPVPRSNIYGARLLLLLGDSITTDHVSPAGAIPQHSLAGVYLAACGVAPTDFNQYSTRRGNHEVMLRGLFSNPRLRNELLPSNKSSIPQTLLQPEGDVLSVYEAALRYRERQTPLLIIAGSDYGGGSSRDWAAKGPALLGVRAVIAESFERIHRSNLIGMGVLPLQFLDGRKRDSLRLDGTESFDLLGLSQDLMPSQVVTLRIHRQTGAVEEIGLLLRAQTAMEVEYLRHGGLLPYVLRQLLELEPVHA